MVKRKKGGEVELDQEALEQMVRVLCLQEYNKGMEHWTVPAKTEMDIETFCPVNRERAKELITRVDEDAGKNLESCWMTMAHAAMK